MIKSILGSDKLQSTLFNPPDDVLPETLPLIILIFKVVLITSFMNSGVKASNLYSALAEAYEKNLTLKSLRAKLQASDEDISKILSKKRPKIDLSAGLGADETTTINTAGVESTKSNKPRNVSVKISQNIFDSGRTKFALKSADNNILANRADLSFREQKILLDTVKSYLNLYVAEENRKLSKNNLVVLQKHLEATQIRFEVGEVTSTDLSQAEARFLKAKAKEIKARGDIEVESSKIKPIFLTSIPGEGFSLFKPIMDVVPYTGAPRSSIINDFNGDGINDIFIADHGVDHEPYPGNQNTLILSAPNGKFIDATSSLPQIVDFSHGVTSGDIDKDGDLDLFVTQAGAQFHVPHYFLRNDGNGKFKKVPDGKILDRSYSYISEVSKHKRRNFYFTPGLEFIDNDDKLDLILLSGKMEGNENNKIVFGSNSGFKKKDALELENGRFGNKSLGRVRDGSLNEGELSDSVEADRFSPRPHRDLRHDPPVVCTSGPKD